MIKGSCACGGIKFEVAKVLALTTCHCSICRKLSGSAFGAYAHVAKKDFRLVSGEELMTEFESTPGSKRKFCKVCGSSAPGQAPYLPTVSIAAGLFDDDPGVKPSLHVFTSSRAPWWEITDDLPQHEKWVPGYEPKK